ncbi:hypothetical protein AFCA_005676 [Aspergillus flavus]|uniref:Glycosyl hydrolase n=1 Tax=Aspergillus flavus TaxID=5059 RepID=A0AB74BPB1_ASPFL|nr:glycosyl hydrolase [Aspergillus flavus]RAQ76379.1 glycosyl hydrolase [Aspergillus flavus]RMZ36273.1 glycosyl hydrolase [Aspergillus flavus]UDD58211.1 hypothetical protein AFCA_005676 [Aspergillus flavus]
MAAFSYIIRLICIFMLLCHTHALALRSQDILAPPPEAPLVLDAPAESPSRQSGLPPSESPPEPSESVGSTLQDLLHALNVMQDTYFELWQGTWPSSIDWTAAVIGTHLSASVASLSSSTEDVSSSIFSDADVLTGKHRSLSFENLINHFFDQTVAFYFGEDAFAVRNQAYDDMLWVVLGWLENLKLQVLHSDLHFDGPSGSNLSRNHHWHGAQFRTPAAHRARLFYGLASGGWDISLCGGGMIWNPRLTPYKNAITNELYISASIGMYLYYPGDVIDSPFVPNSVDDQLWSDGYPHHPAHLQAAIEGYKWLNASNMMGIGGLYGDGFHISGWKSAEEPGTRKCDVLNKMVYTYNQGVILSGLRGLWLATASWQYLYDGHDLVRNVITATGWHNKKSKKWAGLGRGGVLEEACDSGGSCSQDGQTFKGIFFNHLAEFCRPVRPQEERFLASANQTTGPGSDWEYIYDWHQAQCRKYRPWIEHNAEAALMTRDKDGKFGMWWGRRYGQTDHAVIYESPLPPDATDYRNYGDHAQGSQPLQGASRLSGDSIFGVERPVYPAYAPGQTRSTGDAIALGLHPTDYNDRGRGRTVETQSGGVAVLRALYQWKVSASRPSAA